MNTDLLLRDLVVKLVSHEGRLRERMQELADRGEKPEDHVELRREHALTVAALEAIRPLLREQP